MGRFAFCGPTYQSQSPRADMERAMNWYVEQVEAPAGKSPFVLYRTPGLKVFCTLPDAPLRGDFTFLGRTFAVAGASLFEVFADGSYVKYGTVANDGTPATWAANQANQLAVCVGGTVYILDLVLGTLSTAVLLESYVSQIAYCDGYFLALLKASGTMQISTLLDGTTWPGAQVIEVSRFPEKPTTLLSDHAEVWLCSERHAVGYYDSGSSSIFDPIGNAAFIESGIGAPFSVVRADNTLFWIEADERGQGIARRANGYTPSRISNHAVEYRWSLYPKISDAVSYSYQDQGHTFVVFYFPSADATWVFDVATGFWHERGYWDATNGRYQAHRSCCHTFNFGKHLVGDPQSGIIYDMGIGYLDDAGNLLRRERISPPISNENDWIHHSRLQIDCEVGIGPIPPLLDGLGNARGPRLGLSWTDDANTWSNEHFIDVGQAGKYRTRAIFNRLGRSRMRSYKVVVSDAVPWAIIEADLIATPGFDATERLTKRFAKMS